MSSPKSSKMHWSEEETTLLAHLVAKHIKKASTGRYTVDWDNVTSEFEASSMTERTKKALAAHFNVTPHAPLEEMAVGEEGKEKKPEGGVKHRWTDTEEHLLVKSVDKFLDEVTGRVNWDKVHNALTSKGFERSERAIKAHMAGLKRESNAA